MGIRYLIGVIALAGAVAAAPVQADTQGGKKETVSAEQKAFEAARAEAIAAVNKAKSVKGEWRDTRKFIKKAEKAAAEGKWDKAMKLLATAKFQGERGYAQAMEQKHAGHPSYLK
jgi:hypothetical protein